MKEATCVKIISQNQEDFEEIVKLLETQYDVVATSRPILDRDSKKWHIFLNVTKKVEA